MIKKILQSLFRIIIGVIIAIPLLLYPFLYFAQDKLLFMPQEMDNGLYSWLKKKYPHVEEIKIKTPDNVILHGWYLKNNTEKQSPLIIYFGANAEEVSGHIMDIEHFNNYSLLLVNYRGYGLSEGTPSEKTFFNDAVLLYDTFAKRADIDANRIIAFGRSLGTGVAVYLASQRQLQAVILISPYDSIRNLAQKVYPYVPVGLLLKHHFDVKQLAPSIKTRMLALIAEKDKLIPPSHSFALLNAWSGVTEHKIIPNTNHYNISMGHDYWHNITQFLKSL